MKEWRTGSQANYATPVIEQAFSTSGEVLDWLETVLEIEEELE